MHYPHGFDNRVEIVPGKVFAVSQAIIPLKCGDGKLSQGVRTTHFYRKDGDEWTLAPKTLHPDLAALVESGQAVLYEQLSF